MKNIFFSLEEAHSSERKLGLSQKYYFCYREDYLIQAADMLQIPVPIESELSLPCLSVD